ncbi:MAG: sulfatase-like hydrolase/transferase [Pirellulaceae bacterium]
MNSIFLRAMLCVVLVANITSAAEQPNILWITSEDHGPEMGCYGDPLAVTPNVDALASKGMRFDLAWSCAPVCAPARTTIITGLYPPTCGGQHMRSMVPLPEKIRFYPLYLTEAGYYCTNNSKEDYNVRTQAYKGWADSSGKAHYKNRKNGQPFFAIFNETKSHESKIRTRPHEQILDPAKVRVPAYHPDNEETRRDWAQYYDVVSRADATAGRLLDELDRQGLTDETIVFYYGDHGSGMPRSKRWTYNSGLSVPMVVFFPEKWKHLAPKEYQVGGTSDRLVNFVDLAPTVLSLAGVQPPDWMQGHAFAGRYQVEKPQYMYGFRDRMDERYDMIRTVTDGRFQYIRNFNPHFIYGQYVSYNFQTPSTAAWKQAFDAGQCNQAQSHFWKLKPTEELYDLKADRDQVNNLVDSPEHQQKLVELRSALFQWCHDIRDLGFLPEGEIHSRSEGTTPYEMARDPMKYPFDKIFGAAVVATQRGMDDLSTVKSLLSDSDSAVRYWGAVGILNRGAPAVAASRDVLVAALDDSSPYVRVAAGYALGKFGDEARQKQGIDTLLRVAPGKDNTNVFAALTALNAIDKLDDKAAYAKDQLAAMPVGKLASPDGRYSGYPDRVLEKIRQDMNIKKSKSKESR